MSGGIVSSGEAKLIEWLTTRFARDPSTVTTCGIGDDMAGVGVGPAAVWITTDMLLEGVHFDRARHDLEAVGRKAIGCGLSDCAAMAVKPVAATVSLALPMGWRLADSQRLYRGMVALAETFGCAIVGGDTTAWNQGLAIDVTVLGRAYSGLAPVRRKGARLGDVLLVTGALGGSSLGRHMTFTPRVHEAKVMLETWGPSLHAMMDISDGLSLDLHRMCQASGVGAMLDEVRLTAVVHEDARTAANGDEKTPLQHALTDGEDFELLLAVDPAAANAGPPDVPLYQVGSVIESGLLLRLVGGPEIPLKPVGFEHLP